MLPGEVLTGISFFIIIFIAGFIKSYRNGMINKALNKQKTANTAHAQIPEISNKLDNIDENVSETKDKVESIETRVDVGFRTIALIHRDDPDVDSEELRNRLNVKDLDNDLLE